MEANRNPFYSAAPDGSQHAFSLAQNASYGQYQQSQGQPGYAYPSQSKSNPFDGAQGQFHSNPNMPQQPFQQQQQPPVNFPPNAATYQASIPLQPMAHAPLNNYGVAPNQPQTSYNFDNHAQQQGQNRYQATFDPLNKSNVQPPQNPGSSTGFVRNDGGFGFDRSQKPVEQSVNVNVGDELFMFDPLAEEERQRKKAEESRQALILERATYLHSTGLLSESEERLLKELLTNGDKDTESTLLHGMKDGNTEKLKEYLRIHQQRLGIPDETRRDTSESEETITDGDDQNKSLYSELVAAQVEHDKVACPHPRAGGFKETVPESMYMVDQKFVGTILMRISSKKLFRKWKPVFFVLEKRVVKFYDSARQWELRSDPREVYEIHPLMQICKPTLKRTYSVMDDGHRVYYCVFRENPPEAAYGPSGIKVNKFSRALESRRICKFGAHTMLEVSAFAYALHGVIGASQKRSQTQTTVTAAYP